VGLCLTLPGTLVFALVGDAHLAPKPLVFCRVGGGYNRQIDAKACLSITFIYRFQKKEYLILLLEKRKLKVIKSNTNNENRCNIKFTKKSCQRKLMQKYKTPML